MTPTQQKIAVVGGVVAAAALLFWWSSAAAKTPPPRKPGLDFTTRNLDALDAVVAALVSDPQQRPETLGILADQLSYYGLFAQELRLREKIDPMLVRKLAPPPSTGGSGPMTFRQAAAVAK